MHHMRPAISHRSLEHAIGLVQRRRLVLELQHATNVPRMDLGDESDCFVEACVESAKAPEGIERPSFSPRWGTREDTADPVWNRARELEAICEEGDEILLDLYDEDNAVKAALVGHDRVGRARIVVDGALLAGYPRTVQLRLSKAGEKAADLSKPPCEVTCRLLPPPAQRYKVAYFIRHGESKWNKAQDAHAVGDMLHYDHGLSAKGREQAERLAAVLREAVAARGGAGAGAGAGAAAGGGTGGVAAGSPAGRALVAAAAAAAAAPPSDEELVAMFQGGGGGGGGGGGAEALERHFLSAGMIYSSPLTRAIQTAVIGLRDHPRMAACAVAGDGGGGPGGGRESVRLLSDAREIKKVGGMDTVGCMVGKAQIAGRVREELRTLYPAAAGDEDDVERIFGRAVGALDANDAVNAWWTKVQDWDTARDVAARMDEVLAQLKYAPEPCAIVAGHSLFFRRFFATHAAPPRVAEEVPPGPGGAQGGMSASPTLLAQLGQHKMPNCGVVAVLLDVEAPPAECVAAVELVFGTVIGGGGSESDEEAGTDEPADQSKGAKKRRAKAEAAKKKQAKKDAAAAKKQAKKDAKQQQKEGKAAAAGAEAATAAAQQQQQQQQQPAPAPAPVPWAGWAEHAVHVVKNPGQEAPLGLRILVHGADAAAGTGPYGALASVLGNSPASRQCAHGRGTFLQAGDVLSSVNGKPLLGDEAAALSQISATVAAEWAKGELTVTVLRAPAAGGEAGSSGALAVAPHAEVEAEA